MRYWNIKITQNPVDIFVAVHFQGKHDFDLNKTLITIFIEH